MIVISTDINSESGTEVPAGHGNFGPLYFGTDSCTLNAACSRVSGTFWTLFHCQVEPDFFRPTVP